MTRFGGDKDTAVAAFELLSKARGKGWWRVRGRVRVMVCGVGGGRVWGAPPGFGDAIP